MVGHDRISDITIFLSVTINSKLSTFLFFKKPFTLFKTHLYPTYVHILILSLSLFLFLSHFLSTGFGGAILRHYVKARSRLVSEEYTRKVHDDIFETEVDTNNTSRQILRR